MPIHNQDVAAMFDELADLLEIDNANPFRVRAYRNAAQTIRGLARDLGEMVDKGENLTRLQGIGKDLAEKIREILHTGALEALDEVHQKVPASLKELTGIPGLGPKRVRALYKELEITDLSQLEAAARDGRIDELPGFGEKTRQHILEVIAAHRTGNTRFLYSAARDYAEPFADWLKQAEGVRDLVIGGSYRRGKETVGDLDILVTAADTGPVMERFVSYDEVVEVVSRGGTRSTVVLRSGLQVDLRVVPEESFGAALHYFTGSKGHNIQVRRIGQQKGLKINEYGVFKGERNIAGKTEESVFKSVGLPFIPAELREARGEIEAAQAGELPVLVELKDLRGDLHMHTRETDGKADIEAMALAAKEAGLAYIAITDHSRRLSVARGLDEKRLRKQHEAIEKVNGKLKGITVLHGIEVDIMEDGSLDLPDSALGELDLVVGAVHHKFNLSRKQQTERVLRAMERKYFSIFAHPSGRLLDERDAYDIDMSRVIEQAAQCGCFLEINSQPRRMDLTDTYCKAAKEAGVMVSINSDSHNEDGFANLRYGVNQARRGWLEKKDVINTRPLSQLKKLLKKTMG